MGKRGRRGTVWAVGTGALMVIVVAAAGGSRRLGAQGIPASGQDVAPVYEGWHDNPDGTKDLIFGYFNRNQTQELDVAVGEDNSLEPGGPDQGQPTHFYPRRSRFVFRVRVPKDFGKKEVVWTLASNGKKNTAYGTLAPDYYTDDIVMMNDQGAGGSGGGGFNINDNKPPTIKLEGEKSRTATVAQPVTLSATAADDGIPKRRVVALVVPWSEDTKKGVARIGSRCCADSASGLRLNWFVYRGPAANVTFDPPQFEQWEDYRDGRNSPWSAGWDTPPVPADNRWKASAKFSAPGTYVLRAQAHDGGLMAWDDVTVVVK